jgi:ribonuclease Z
MLKTCIFENKVTLEIHEIHPKKNEILTILDNEDFQIQTALLDHGVACLGYSFVEKDTRRINMEELKKHGITGGPEVGKLQSGESVITSNGKTISPEMISSVKKGLKITFILDTGLCENAISLSEFADLLVCEATYSSELGEKAENYKHMTARDAAILANNASVKKLILTHLSQRYKDPGDVLEDAKNVFENVEVAHDFMKVKM